MGWLMAYVSIVLLITSWLTHVIVCAVDAAWAFMLFGAVIFPVGIAHGFAQWFGFF